MKNIKVDPEFQKLISPLEPDELVLLEESLLKEGCRDPLVVWQDTICDGHNRYAICKKHNIDFKTVSKEFSDRDEAKVWIIKNQLGRRNISGSQRALLLAENKDLVAAVQARARERELAGKGADDSGGRGKAKNPVPPVAQGLEEGRSTEVLGQMAAVGKETMRLALIVYGAVDGAVEHALLTAPFSAWNRIRRLIPGSALPPGR